MATPAGFENKVAYIWKIADKLHGMFYNGHNESTWQPTVLLAPLLVSDDGEIVRRKLAATATYLAALQNKLAAEDDASFEGSAVRGRHGISELGLDQFSRRHIGGLLLLRLDVFR